jgi:DNA modification methylase
MYPGRSKIEMFARGEAREGWTVWGLEATLQDPTTEYIYANSTNTKTLDEHPDLVRFRKFGRPVFQNDKPKKENFWLFHRVDPRLGQRHPGQIPGQIAMNVLHNFTDPGDLVVDPFAGGGSTIDACRVMERHCLAYDIKPMRPDIKQWDITKGFHPDISTCDMVFLDPPYWNLMSHLYTKESMSSMSLQDFMAAMRKLAHDCYKVLKPGGYVALVMMPFTDEKYEGKFLDLSYICMKGFESAGFEEKQRISAPLPFQTKSVYDVVKINIKKGLLLDTNRDVIIFAKKDGEKEK